MVSRLQTLTLAAINSFIFLANPQKRHPSPNTAYPNKSAGLRPKMSLSLPYSGWNEVSVRKYLQQSSSLNISLSCEHQEYSGSHSRRSNPRSVIQRLQIAANLPIARHNDRLISRREENLASAMSAEASLSGVLNNKPQLQSPAEYTSYSSSLLATPRTVV